MRRAIAVVVVVLIAIAIVLVWKMHRSDDDVHTAAGSATAVVSGSNSTTPHATTPKLEHATRVTPEEHRRLAERIAAAQAAHASHVAAPAAPSLPEQDLAQQVQDNVLTALKEAIPFLAACYEQYQPDRAKPGMNVSAQMTLTGDPDIGTVIDADQIYDDNHKPLAKQLDDCLRNTMQTLALPPLDIGTSVRIQYSFRFGDDDK